MANNLTPLPNPSQKHYDPKQLGPMEQEMEQQLVTVAKFLKSQKLEPHGFNAPSPAAVSKAMSDINRYWKPHGFTNGSR
ncbi:MAG: hypothetical protein LBE70_00950 [Nitrososphaerota archaeon]|jgi:hypothetical protein|nr:hypothetical protein [Nitrososphaerota archaeon]